MPKYRVVVTERVTVIYLPKEIEADSPEEAEQLGEEMRVDGELEREQEIVTGIAIDVDHVA